MVRHPKAMSRIFDTAIRQCAKGKGQMNQGLVQFIAWGIAMRNDSATPNRIVEALVGYWNTEVLKAAIDLDLFTILGGRSLTLASLARRSGAERKGLRRLCDYLAQLGFLRKNSREYSSARDAARYLDRQSPWSLCTLADFFTSPFLIHAFAQLPKAVRLGQMTLAGDGLLEPDNPAWINFAKATWPLRLLEAEMVVRALESQRLARGRILELGCGGSPMGITLLKRHPKLSLVAQDWSRVLTVTAEHARQAGLADRIELLPGDARTIDFAGPYDLVLMVNFLDYFDETTRLALLRKVHAALRPGGSAAVYAPLLEAPAGSWSAVAYNLLLLLTTPAGEASTLAQIDAVLEKAGFTRARCRGDMPLVTARKPPFKGL
jgi:SAM-dependent methyltransferase